MKQEIKYKGSVYPVRYTHDKATAENPLYSEGLKGKKLPLTAITTAFIVDEEDKVIVSGIAECSAKDQFSRKIGRMISYGRLLKAISEG